MTDHIKQIKGTLYILGFFLILSCYAAVTCLAVQKSPKSIEINSKAVTIDRVYKSMEGITDSERFFIDSKGIGKTAPTPSSLLWVTGGKIDIFKENGKLNDTEKHLCHAYLKLDNDDYKANQRYELHNKTNQQIRLFTFVQGQAQINLPEGYGIPVLSSEFFEFNFMVINPEQPKQPFEVTARGAFDYIPDNQLKKPLKPLFMRIVGMKIPVKTDTSKPQVHCDELGDLAGSKDSAKLENNAPPAEFSLHKIHKNVEGGFDQVYHWMVPPGRHEYHYQLESNVLANMPFDTTVHYINAHLHAHGEYVEFRNLTTGKTLFRSTATNNPERNGLLDLTDFSSKKGFPIQRDHQYEMVAVYNNTTDHDIDAMAIFFFYLLDKKFDKNNLKLSIQN